MKCLKCDNDALSGKALCAACFEIHQTTAETVGSEEWIEKKLKETRAKASQRRIAKEKPSFQADLQNAFVRVAPIMICFGAVVIFASWFMNNGGFRFTRSPKPAASAPPKGKDEFGTGGMAEIADEAQAAADQAPVPTEAPSTNEGGSNAESDWRNSEPTPTPTDTPTQTPTETPTNTPTETAAP
jgi:hypothetical protein